MRALQVALVGLLAAGCARHAGRTDGSAGVGTVDASITGNDHAPTADAGNRPEAWPVPDAPPSTCSPAAGCGDAGTCWQTVSGAYACTSFAPSPAPSGGSCDAGAGAGVFRPEWQDCCLTHADCTRSPRGRCVSNAYMYCGGVPPPPRNHCRYDWCLDDTECPAGSRCFPNGYSGDSAPHCITASCRTAADCTRGPGGACVSYTTRASCTGANLVTVYCQYNNDVCRGPADCPPDPSRPNGSACVPDEDGHGTRCVPYVPPSPPPP
jgi:hypothetical protein